MMIIFTSFPAPGARPDRPPHPAGFAPALLCVVKPDRWRTAGGSAPNGTGNRAYQSYSRFPGVQSSACLSFVTNGETDAAHRLRRQLLDLFDQVRRPTYRSLAAHADRDGRALRISTLSDLLNGRATPRWDTVETFVRACTRYAQTHDISVAPDLVDLDRWHAAYRAMENAFADQAARREQVTGRAAPGRRRPLVVPAQLPPDLTTFTGRAHYLAELDKLLPDARGGPTTAVNIAAIVGTAGVGKTALAIHWAHQIAGRFVDGQLYVNLRGFEPSGHVMDPPTAVRAFLDAFGVPPQRIPVDTDAQVALYRSLLAGKRVLIVLDNARDSAQIRPLLPGAPGCLVVVTSRNQLTGLVAAHGAHPIVLDLLTEDEARQLLAHRLGADELDAEPQAAKEIIDRCARLPLALSLIAAHAATRPHTGLTRLARQLHDIHEHWQTLASDDPASDVRTVFSWSYRALTPDAARMFRLLGLHPGPDLSLPAAASLAGEPTGTVSVLLAELSGANLITEHKAGRYTLHDLLRAYAIELTNTTDTEEARRTATSRIFDHYLHAAYAAEGLLHPARLAVSLPAAHSGVIPENLSTTKEALHWFTTEHSVLVAAAKHAASTGLDAYAWQLARIVSTYLHRQGHWHDHAILGRAAVAAAERLADRPGEAAAHADLALTYTRMGHFDDADRELRRALDLFTVIHDLAGQARVHLCLGYLWERRGQPAQARDHARRALRIFQAVGHRGGQARALNNLGWLHAQLGEYHLALATCRQALVLHRELDDRQGQAAAWDSLGYIHHRLGNDGETLTCYHHAADIYRELGDRYEEATTLINLGDSHADRQDLTTARGTWLRALTILTELDHPDADTIRAKLHDLNQDQRRAG
jgi:tetratricopeptide (TPR) repeat protein